MKKLMLLLIIPIWGVLQSHAQIIDTTGGLTLVDSSDYRFEQNFARLYDSVNLDNITTGFLMNRAVNFIDPIKLPTSLYFSDNDAF